MELWLGSVNYRMSTDCPLNCPPKPSFPPGPLPVSQRPCRLWPVIPASPTAAELKRHAQEKNNLPSSPSWTCPRYFNWDISQEIACSYTFYWEVCSLWVCFYPSACTATCLLCGCHVLHLVLGAFHIFSLGTCCDSSGISKSMQSKICQEEISL